MIAVEELGVLFSAQGEAALNAAFQNVGTSAERTTTIINGLNVKIVQQSKEAAAAVEEVGNAFGSLGPRIERIGVMSAFAMQSLFDGTEMGVTRVLRSIGMLGFAFNPFVGAAVTAGALIVEEFTKTFHAVEHEAELSTYKAAQEIAEMGRKSQFIALNARQDILQYGDREAVVGGRARDENGRYSKTEAMYEARQLGIEGLTDKIKTLTKAQTADAEANKNNTAAYLYGTPAYNERKQQIEELTTAMKALQAQYDLVEQAKGHANQGPLRSEGGTAKGDTSSRDAKAAEEAAKEAAARQAEVFKREGEEQKAAAAKYLDLMRATHERELADAGNDFAKKLEARKGLSPAGRVLLRHRQHRIPERAR